MTGWENCHEWLLLFRVSCVWVVNDVLLYCSYLYLYFAKKVIRHTVQNTE